MSVVPFRPEERSWVALMAPAVELAKAVANTDFVPRPMRGSPAAITAAILYGDEVGLGPMQSLAKIAVVDGRPCLYAEAQRALILSAGHDLWVEESTATRVTIAGRRRDSDQTTRVTWTMDDAKRANLAGKQAWRQYPRQMLLARASAELARAVFADAIGGLAAVEEALEEEPSGEGDSAPTPLESGQATRRRRRTPPAPVSAPPEPEPPPLPGDAPAAEPEPVPEPPPLPGEEGPPMLTDKDRRFIRARQRELGLSDDQLRAACSAVSDQPSTSKVPRAKLDELLAAMEAEHLAGETAREADQLADEAIRGPQASLDVGDPPHRDDG